MATLMAFLACTLPTAAIDVNNAGLERFDFRQVVKDAKAKVFPTVVFIKCVAEVMESGVKQSRDSVFAALQGSQLFTGANGTLTQLAAQAAHWYSDSPLQQN